MNVRKNGWVIGLSVALMVAATASGWCKSSCPEADKELVGINLSKETIAGAYRLVSVPDLKKWMDEKKDMLIVDTMPFQDSYKLKHIPGAVQMEFPIPEMNQIDDKKKEEFLKLLGPDKDRTLVFYCGFVECTRSHNGAMWAAKLGYKNVYRCPGGINGWEQAGYPAAKVD